EDVSYRTGCWLYIAVQHPNARSSFIHYSSRKLRKDSPTQVASLHKEVSQVMTGLYRAERRDKAELEGEKQRAIDERQKAEERANVEAERAKDAEAR
ncbi:hypothetical protein BKA70DRAFT_1036058, partial [Coprinopsis sp. MPI-PUGE-AT-0042]